MACWDLKLFSFFLKNFIQIYNKTWIYPPPILPLPPTDSISPEYPSLPTSCPSVAVVIVDNLLSPASSAHVYVDVGASHGGVGMLSMATPSNKNEPPFPVTTHCSSVRSGTWRFSISSVIKFLSCLMCGSYAGHHSCCESDYVLPWRQHFTALLPIPWSFILSASSSAMFPKPWCVGC